MAKVEEKQHSWGAAVLVFIGIIAVMGALDSAKKDTNTAKKDASKPNEIIIDGNGIVKKPFIVCFSSKSCKEMSDLRMRGDINGAMYLHKTQECFLLKDGTRVSILEQNIMSPSKVRAYMDNGNAVDLYTYFD